MSSPWTKWTDSEETTLYHVLSRVPMTFSTSW